MENANTTLDFPSLFCGSGTGTMCNTACRGVSVMGSCRQARHGFRCACCAVPAGDCSSAQHRPWCRHCREHLTAHASARQHSRMHLLLRNRRQLADVADRTRDVVGGCWFCPINREAARAFQHAPDFGQHLQRPLRPLRQIDALFSPKQAFEEAVDLLASDQCDLPKTPRSPECRSAAIGTGIPCLIPSEPVPKAHD